MGRIGSRPLTERCRGSEDGRTGHARSPDPRPLGHLPPRNPPAHRGLPGSGWNRCVAPRPPTTTDRCRIRCANGRRGSPSLGSLRREPVGIAEGSRTPIGAGRSLAGRTPSVGANPTARRRRSSSAPASPPPSSRAHRGRFDPGRENPNPTTAFRTPEGSASSPGRDRRAGSGSPASGRAAAGNITEPSSREFPGRAAASPAGRRRSATHPPLEVPIAGRADSLLRESAIGINDDGDIGRETPSRLRHSRVCGPLEGIDPTRSPGAVDARCPAGSAAGTSGSRSPAAEAAPFNSHCRGRIATPARRNSPSGLPPHAGRTRNDRRGPLEGDDRTRSPREVAFRPRGRAYEREDSKTGGEAAPDSHRSRGWDGTKKPARPTRRRDAPAAYRRGGCPIRKECCTEKRDSQSRH